MLPAKQTTNALGNSDVCLYYEARGNMKISIPHEAQYIIGTLEESGCEAYIVGGCVRDSIMGRKPKDWDICTSALPEQVMGSFPKTIATGLKHGTVTVVAGSKHFEVTSFRIDGAYSDSRHPDRAVFGASLEEDLSRRDFTINAMAYNPKTGLVDLFGGELDIENKTVRCVGDPGKRFHEDALRIMRALRFASEFDLSIDKKTLAAMAESRELLRHISAERVSAELSRLLVGDGAERVLTAYAPSILAVPIPELSALIGFRQNNPAHDLDVWAHTAKAVAAAPKDHAIRLSLLLHDIAKPLSYTEDESGIGHFYGHEAQGADMSKEILHRLRYSNEIIVAAVELILHHDADIDASTKSVKRWLNRLGEDRFRQLLTVQRADAAAYTKEYTEKKHTLLDAVEPLLDETIRQDQCFSLRDLAVNGKDLIELGMPQGEALGKILHELLGFVLNEEADNSRESLLAVAASIIGDKYGK